MSEIDKAASVPDIPTTDVTANHNQQNTPPLPSDPGAHVADEADVQLATDAAAHLEASGNAVESFGGSSQEIDRQAVVLTDWARSKGCVLSDSYFVGLLKHRSTTAEHEVYYRATDNRAVKCTHGGSFGVTPDPKGAQRAATPLFYLRRLELMNRIFNSALRLEGVLMGKSMILFATAEQPRLVTSQPWIDSAKPNQPHPSQKEIDDFMHELGFTVLTRSYYGWQRKQDHITILDARPDNFIMSAKGVVPIDLVISEGKAPTSSIVLS